LYRLTTLLPYNAIIPLYDKKSTTQNLLRSTAHGPSMACLLNAAWDIFCLLPVQSDEPLPTFSGLQRIKTHSKNRGITDIELLP